MNVVGDYRLSSSVNCNRWALPPSSNNITLAGGTASALNEFDYACAIASWGAFGNPATVAVSSATGTTTGNSFCGNLGSNAYCSSINLETSNGIEISGLNAEEQSDISFMAQWSAVQASNFSIEVYTYVDVMMILKENNQIELIQ